MLNHEIIVCPKYRQELASYKSNCTEGNKSRTFPAFPNCESFYNICVIKDLTEPVFLKQAVVGDVFLQVYLIYKS